MICQRSLISLLPLPWLVSGAAILQQPLFWDEVEPSFGPPGALQRLQAEVKDALIDTAPIGQPCWPSHSMKGDCDEVHASKTNDVWTAEQPGGYFYVNWASCQATNETCSIPFKGSEIPLNASCNQGSVPTKMINVSSIENLPRDVQAAFRFANESGKTLVIKNTGHDWKGRSSAPDSLALWTRQLHHPHVPIVLNTNFTPTGCNGHSRETVFHFGPGEQWGRAYVFADKHNLAILGGTCPTVGIAGWLSGGGHSPITPIYGMGVDNVRQIEIITPGEGKIIANECQNEDIFFAVRGGGGGTYGVITNVTYKAVEKSRVLDFRYKFPDLDETQTREYFKIITSNAVAWSQKGWGGYIGSSSEGQYGIIVNANTTLSDEEARADMKNLTDFVTKRAKTNYTWKMQPSWYSFIDEVMVPPTAHIVQWGSNVGSRLLPKEVFDSSTKQNDLLDALMKIHRTGINRLFMFVAPTRFNHTTTSALHPSWKDAVMLLRINDRWDQFNETQTRIPAISHFAKVHEHLEPIRKLAPGMGVSINEADIWEPEHEEAFWGRDNHERLLKVKHRTDPHNLLSVWHGVNSTLDNANFKCYPRKPVL